MLKHLLRITIVFVLLFSGHYYTYAQTKTLYDQLVYVNATWKNQADVNPSLLKQAAQPLNEQEIVRLHLQQTELLLRNRNTKHLSATQQANRIKNLDVLHKYWQAGVFPQNTRHTNRQPYFIDEFNTYCAVGYLMKQSGADAMARAIHQHQNFSYLADIQHPDLMKWVENSGLTFDELALIQPGYGGEWPAAVIEMHYNNVGADVNEYIEFHQSNGGLIGMLPFTSVLFYDYQGNLYKTLTVSDLQQIGVTNYFYYYQFPAGNNFADSGKIVLMSSYGFPNPAPMQIITYNSTGIRQEDYTGFQNPPYIRQFSATESETTPVGSSITFCGVIINTWSPSVLPATIGTLNPCTIGALPITLLSFDFELQKNYIDINWQTSSETNNSYFEIERSSNGIDFTSIGKVSAGTGNSTTVKSYSFPDKNPQYINHYRLKQVDKDGKYSYSKILFVKFPGVSSLVVLQNPVNQVLKVRILDNGINNGRLVICDLSGRTVQQSKAVTGLQQINVSKLSAGKYLVQLFTEDGQVFNQSFIKQ